MDLEKFPALASTVASHTQNTLEAVRTREARAQEGQWLLTQLFNSASALEEAGRFVKPNPESKVIALNRSFPLRQGRVNGRLTNMELEISDNCEPRFEDIIKKGKVEELKVRQAYICLKLIDVETGNNTVQALVAFDVRYSEERPLFSTGFTEFGDPSTAAAITDDSDDYELLLAALHEAVEVQAEETQLEKLQTPQPHKHN